jgi:signal transduction histidine kinase
MPDTTVSIAAVAQVPLPHVLLVEDQERAARGLEELLALEGFRVTRAADGPSGLDLARASQVDAIVLDVSTAVRQQRVQAIGEVAAAVGHEINHPLAAALGTLDLLQLRPDLSPDARRDLAACRAHLRRIASTLSQLTEAL